MISLFLVIAVISVVAVVIAMFVMAIRRNYARKKAAQLTNEIIQIAHYSKEDRNTSPISVAEFDFNVKSEIETNFENKVISLADIQLFKNHYFPTYHKALNSRALHERLGIKFPTIIEVFIDECSTLDKRIAEHNYTCINAILDTHKQFFDTCLKYPLDRQQRRSIVSEEDNCLVVSSAGSGKTSSIIGKVKYLTNIKGIRPERILLISYTNKAAAELTERLDTLGLRGYTFHKLALDIIGKATGAKPSVCDNTDSVFIESFRSLTNTTAYKNSVIKYFADYQNIESVSEVSESERREQLSELKKKEIKAMLPDMDGRTIYVRSEQEAQICFALSKLGIKFRYEEPYEFDLADEKHSQYHPDFSIYYPHFGETKRIYLEHFGINEQGLVPAWFAKDKNISYEEANKLYNDGITWKVEAHKKHGTTLITTTSADFQSFNITDKLKELLHGAGVPIIEVPDEELYELVLPKGSKREKALIRLIATFVTLLKTSCKSVDEVLRMIESNRDKRSGFIVKDLFLPIYTAYEQELKRRGQIDFTDAIIQATNLCNTMSIAEYDYIIVDEFQDISVDRYNFLKALRKGTTLAKLYCVGDDWQSIYRFSGSDMSLFNQFADYFGLTEINKIETTYRFGEPLVSLSANFIQRNTAQITKQIHPFNREAKTELAFCGYDNSSYCSRLEQIVSYIPKDKSVFLLGRYSFDDIYLSGYYKCVKENDKFYYVIGERKIEFLTAHKSKGLEADYVILLQCNRDTYGFPSMVSDDPVLNYVLTQSDRFPFSEERRLFYVAITRAKIKTFVMYDYKSPSVFVDEFLHPEKVNNRSYEKHPNSQKRWTRGEDDFLIALHNEGKTIKEIALKMGRSQTAIVMRLGKLKSK
ncbi:MAG: UvrD-helicase domain-containing protein [Alistipes sp.]|nr:UvrD-helicase domain-containing protein [Alistipes sp.]